jgi:hypothetical protein
MVQRGDFNSLVMIIMRLGDLDMLKTNAMQGLYLLIPRSCKAILQLWLMTLCEQRR